MKTITIWNNSKQQAFDFVKSALRLSSGYVEILNLLSKEHCRLLVASTIA